MGHELSDLPLKLTRQVIIFQQNAVLQRAVPALNLALRHRVIELAACEAEIMFLQPVLQFCREVAGPVITEQFGALFFG